MERYVCIHGHFYQPPRENPWLEAIEVQDSAYPYHDWNARVAAECYGPNTASPVLDGQGHVAGRVNNYAHISFDVGPTLLSWMERVAPTVYLSILAADRESRQRFSGHGSAMAQAYNHLIMPLANPRDKRTQVLWGLRDFQHRFGRSAEGMWLPETAVDIQTLEDMAEWGVRFTILAPRQAKRTRRLGALAWDDASGERVDPSHPYLQRLPSGRSIAVFFYDGPLSQAVAFEGILHRGEDLAARLLGSVSSGDGGPHLAHIATDGETYGHHHRLGDMALAYALKVIQRDGRAHLTNYGELLERHPPAHEVQVTESTSWSCAHGVERWRSDCGCTPGLHPGWSQAWRRPLRDAVDWLRDELAARFEESGAVLFRDPWAARDAYIDVVLDRSQASLDRCLAKQAARVLTRAERVEAVKLLEMQRHAMLMFASCGWFFDDLARIETVQVLRYAARAMELAGSAPRAGLESAFLELLEPATSNLARYGNGRDVYERLVRPSVAGLEAVARHYAVTSLYREHQDQALVQSHTVDRVSFERLESGTGHACVGRVAVRSNITGESALFDMAVVGAGSEMAGTVAPVSSGSLESPGLTEVRTAFSRGEPTTAALAIKALPGASLVSFTALLRDERRAIVDLVVDTLEGSSTVREEARERNARLVRLLESSGILLRPGRSEPGHPPPGPAGAADGSDLAALLSSTVIEMLDGLTDHPSNLPLLQRTTAVLRVARSLAFPLPDSEAQHLYYRLRHEAYPRFKDRANQGDANAAAWVRHFEALGGLL